MVFWFSFGSGFALFPPLAFELVLLLGSLRLFLRSIHGSSSISFSGSGSRFSLECVAAEFNSSSSCGFS